MKNLMTRGRGDAATRRFEEFPIGWVIIWLLLALSLWPSLAKAQQSTQATTVAASPRPRVPASPRLVPASAVAERFLLGEKAFFVSSGVVSARDLGFNRGFLVRDPDGHVMQLIEK